MAMKGDNLGVMMEGWLLAPKTGTYTFSVNSDDSSEVWIAPKPDSKSGLKKVVWLNGCCRKVNGNVRVKLFKGESYYMRAYIKEGGGGEYGKIGMRVGKREYYPIRECDGGPSAAIFLLLFLHTYIYYTSDTAFARSHWLLP
eukprot:COSAG01_NODE_1598_length_9772_cov_8.388671_10_plen_142_part_00